METIQELATSIQVAVEKLNERMRKADETRMKKFIEAGEKWNEGLSPTIGKSGMTIHAPCDFYVWEYREGGELVDGEFMAGEFLPIGSQFGLGMGGGDKKVRAEYVPEWVFLHLKEALNLNRTAPNFDRNRMGMEQGATFEYDGELCSHVYCRSKVVADLLEEFVDAPRKVKREEEAKRREEELKRREEELAAAEPVPYGRIDVCGEVLSVKSQESMYGWTLKMLVKDRRGFKLWGSVPSAIDDVSRGDKIKFTAAVERSKDDEKFGFYKRPTKAAYVESFEDVA
tara:strand:- start:5493 stop:6347 length:855 start_codon:yes stop_codon:yes gene_type:complete